MVFKVEIEQESDGRWLAEVPDLPGVMTYGGTREEALGKVKALALREEIGPRMLARLAKHTGLDPEDL
jgi:hypothetical protein